MIKNRSTRHISITFVLLYLLTMSCNNDNDDDSQRTPLSPQPPINYVEQLNLSKDKAKYNPGEGVRFFVDDVVPNTIIKYKFLGQTIGEAPLASTSWQWSPPSDDYKGYMVELIQIANEQQTVLGTAAVDVSSDWTKFPRYGFLSDFGAISEAQRNSVIANLKNFHINGLQYYDWHAKHHIPLPLDAAGNPKNSWVDLFNREVKLETVAGYIEEGHNRNMASMFYNLLFGAWHPEQGDGFSERWLIYNDRFHNKINSHDLDGFGSILITNPQNEEWQNYIFTKTKDVYDHLNFDGWHLDQLGDRGQVYDYGGHDINLKNGYNNFLTALTANFPSKKHVLNAVDQFGYNEILSTPMDFAYSEVWTRMQYADLVQVILENNEASNNQLNTVLAAYINYESSDGFFNTPSVLLADAVIFAFGGAHMELGEHMLSREYFPSNNLQMDNELKNSLKEYYDFMTAYQNLLRDGGEFITTSITSTDLNFNNWPPVFGNVSAVAKRFANRQVVQLLNFNGVSSLNWRDNEKTQTRPHTFYNVNMTIDSPMSVSKVWFASPDFEGGASKELEFKNNGNSITFTLPYLNYWSMIVFEN
ncbi:glycoside hydrolase family 66 protein [Gelidibacter japonicus]|jgi:dextranase|uniref:glycoside hydrolase family 66 protein n=2 Tax=Gelidibacter japonicus TaxID=1962232 RepID=UPI002AFF2F1A|nr:glycoside hydrolase family 66 protein [Gelidibacter japonicus]